LASLTGLLRAARRKTSVTASASFGNSAGKETKVKLIRTLVVVSIVLASVAAMGSAFAQGSAESPPPEVQGGGFGPHEEGPSGEAVGPTNLGPQGGALPFTGGQVLVLAAVGVVAVAAGTALVRRTRGDTARL
jgi:hypothetical protein